MKKFLAVLASFVLVSTLSTPAVSDYQTSATQRTLSAFSGSVTSLSASQRAEIRRVVESNPSAEKFICTGIRFESQPMSENIKVRKRAKAACDYAKQLNPELSTFYQNKPTSARSYAGKVLLTVKVTKVPSSRYLSYRFKGDTQDRKGDLEQTWSAASYAPLQPGSVRAKAYQALRASAKGSVTAEVNWMIAENVPMAMSIAYRKQVAQALELFDFTGIKGPLDILIYTEKDKQFMKDYWSARYDAESTIARKLNDLKGFEENPMYRSVGGSAGPTRLLDDSYPTLVVDFQMASVHKPESHLLIEHVAHEVAHLWQYHALDSAERWAAGVNFDLVSAMPCHAMEGGASTMANIVASPHADWAAVSGDVIIRRTARDENISRMTKAMAISWLERSEQWSDCHVGYSSGMLLYEWMIAEFGAQAFYDIYRKIGEQRSFEAVIEEITGLTVSEFYEAAAPYIVATFNKALAIGER